MASLPPLLPPWCGRRGGCAASQSGGGSQGGEEPTWEREEERVALRAGQHGRDLASVAAAAVAIVVAVAQAVFVRSSRSRRSSLGRRRIMSDLVARTGRHQQRYEDGHRLVAGCIPYRYCCSDDNSGGKRKKTVEVLMINSPSGPGLLFPKGGWENDETVEEAAEREALEEAGVRGEIKELLGYYKFKSRTQKDEFCPDGSCKAAMFPLLVKEELCSWPEQSTRQRTWLTIPEAEQLCRHSWMQQALVEDFLKWHADNTTDSEEGE